MSFQVNCRAAAVSFLTDYASSAGIKMQVYRARPRTLFPPTGFVDAINETLDHSTNLTRREVEVNIIVVHGIYDSGHSADQKDAFVDGLIDWSETRFHQVSTNSMVAVDTTEDLPEYVPTWLPPEEQKVYYATRIALGGFRRGT